MSSRWYKRKSRLGELLNSPKDEDDEGLALDRILHGQSVIGKTSKTVEIDKLRFTDKDLDTLGTLDRGQFGVIDIVSCQLDGRVYARKSVEKRFALRNRDQCFPQLERDLLLQAHKTNSCWAPHLLCAFQTSTHLSLVMEFAEGGTLWDVLESSPLDGRIAEADVTWWVPQIVSAINWCHQEGFVHRDIKPHNFVLNQNSHVLLIDFGSAAPLLPPEPDGSRLVPKRHCFVPCGTCDYISPEILQAHEEALVALEMSADGNSAENEYTGGYGVEVDWWSLGAMLYEMVYGIVPFFANDIKQTYFNITNHQRYLRFDSGAVISRQLQALLQGFLSTADQRLGRKGVAEIMNHPFFSDIVWSTIRDRPKPQGLHLPQFNYDVPLVGTRDKPEPLLHSPPEDSDSSRPFAFSTLLQPSQLSSLGASSLQMTPASKFNRSAGSAQVLSSFIGFSWGPPLHAFDDQTNAPPHTIPSNNESPYLQFRPTPKFDKYSRTSLYPFTTPVRPNTSTPHHTLPRTSTVRRTAPRRPVSDREAMKQLVDLVGMSARKKVVESGRKPRVLTMSSIPGSKSRSGMLKELRFNTSPIIIDRRSSSGDTSRLDAAWPKPPYMCLGSSCEGKDTTDTETETEIPPSPSPRPGSAMSIMSRRSQTPTMTGSLAVQGNLGVVNFEPINMPRATSYAHHLPKPSTSDTLSDDILDDLEKRHAKLTADIGGIHRRLGQLASRVSCSGTEHGS